MRVINTYSSVAKFIHVFLYLKPTHYLLWSFHHKREVPIFIWHIIQLWLYLCRGSGFLECQVPIQYNLKIFRRLRRKDDLFDFSFEESANMSAYFSQILPFRSPIYKVIIICGFFHNLLVQHLYQRNKAPSEMVENRPYLCQWAVWVNENK